MDDISVLIRCRNEQSHIGYAIQSCLDTLDNPEIIVVDNDSSDDSLKIVNLFAHDTDLPLTSGYSHVRTLSISQYSPGKALNYGVLNSTRRYILVLSSHCIIRAFDKTVFNLLDDYKAVFGNQIPIYHGKKISKRYLWSHFSDEHDITNLYSVAEGRYFLHNAFCLYSKDYLLEYPFDEKLVGKEDRYWANDLVNRGGSYIYKHDIVADHIYTSNGNTWKGVG